MSDGGIKEFSLGDGTRAKVPAQHLEKWMRRMEARGVSYEPAGAAQDDDGETPEPADDVPGEPINYPPSGAPAEVVDDEPDPVAAPQPTPQAVAPVATAQPQPPRELSPWEALANAGGRFAESAAQSFQESAPGALMAGMGRVVTFGHDDEMAGALAGFIPMDDGTGIPRTYGRGSPVADQVEQAREAKAMQDETQPLAVNAGKGIAAGVGSAVLAPYLTVAAPLAAAAGTAAIGMAEGGGNSLARTPEELAGDTAEGGAWSLGGGAIGEAAPEVLRLAAAPVRAVGKKIAGSPWLKEQRNANRAAAAGGYGGKLAELEAANPGYIQRLGQFAEDAELGRRGNPTRSGGALTGGAAGSIYGYATSDKPDFVGKASDAAAWGALGAAGGAAAKLPTPSKAAVYRDNAKAMMNRLGSEMGRAIDAVSEYGYGYPKIELRKKLVAALRELPNPNTEEGIALRETMKRKIGASLDSLPEELDARELQRLKNQYEDLAGYEPNATRSETAIADGYARLKNEPRSMLERSMREQALPEDEAMFFDARSKYGMASDIAAQGTKRAAQEAGNQMLSLPAVATGNPAAWASAEIAKHGGRDMTADALSALIRAGEGMSRAGASMPNASQVPAAAAVAAKNMTPASPETASAWETLSGLGRSPATADQSAEQRSQSSEHHRAPQMIRNALKAYPQALGRFKGQLQAAANDPEEMGRLVAELLRDPEFRDRVMPALQEADDETAKRGGLR